MTLVVDTDAVVTPAAAAAMKSAGVAGCALYVNGKANLQASKGAVLGAGLGLASVQETTGQEGLKGTPVGAALAQGAIHLHEAAGGPRGALIWLSEFDFNALPNNVPSCQGFIDGAQSVFHPAGYRGGFYGSAGLGQHVTGWDAWWQSESTGFWDNATPWPGASLVQRTGLHAYYGGVEVDGNVLQKPANWGNWVTPAPSPQPPLKEDAMKVIIVSAGGTFTGGYFLLTSAGDLLPIESLDDANALTAALGQTAAVAVSHATASTWPHWNPTWG